MAMSDLTIIGRSLTGRMFSTVTTVVTVAVAVGLMFVLLSLRDAGRQAFERGSGNMHLIVSMDSSPLVSVLNGVFYANAPARPISWQRFQQIADDGRVEWAIPNQQGDSFQGLPVLATTPQFFTHFTPAPGEPWRLAQGTFFEGPFDLVLGARAARATGLRVGDKIHLTHGRSDARAGGAPAHVHYDFTYRVAGILEPTGSAHDRALFSDLRASWIIHAHDRRRAEDPNSPRPTEADLTDADRLVTGIYLRCVTRGGAATSPLVPVVASELRSDPSIVVAEPKAEIDKLFAIVSNVDQVLLAMAAVVMVSSGIGIMLALYNSMEQRRRQIAVLRVLGASRPRIFGLVLTESAVLGALGAAAGLGLGLIGAQAAAGVMKERLGLVVQPSLPLDWMIVMAAATVVLASLAGLVPAVMAYRTSVARNLRPIG